ncbi:MAG: 3-oxoacyl-[acyl-carrier-protein] reductase [Dehalococcoidia bacterium]|nr:3-oxoacyl-[acyl-carrier-protein] reductase [Dehalococcoidia bacterium]
MDLEGKVAVVTGSSRGIGRAIALKLAGLGARVVVNYNGNAEAAAEVGDAIRQAGGQTIIVQADVSKAEEADRLVKAALAAFGRIDILVNNAGITRDGLVLRMSEDDWDAVLSTNLKGAFLCTRAVLRPMLRQRSGRIINVSSVVGLAGNAGQANYVAAKAGLIGLTKSIAKEVGSRGITANAVAPGFIDTEMTRQLSDNVKGEVVKQIALGHFGTAEDVAEAVAFLSSKEAAYITGQVLNVDGGMVMS